MEKYYKYYSCNSISKQRQHNNDNKIGKEDLTELLDKCLNFSFEYRISSFQ